MLMHWLLTTAEQNLLQCLPDDELDVDEEYVEVSWFCLSRDDDDDDDVSN